MTRLVVRCARPGNACVRTNDQLYGLVLLPSGVDAFNDQRKRLDPVFEASGMPKLEMPDAFTPAIGRSKQTAGNGSIWTNQPSPIRVDHRSSSRSVVLRRSCGWLAATPACLRRMQVWQRARRPGSR
jgi:hypothetical protein